MSTGGKADIDTKLGNLYEIEKSKDSVCKLGNIDKDPIYNGGAEGIKLLYCGNYPDSNKAFSAAVNGFSKSSMGDYKGLFYELPILLSYQGLNQLQTDEIFYPGDGEWEKFESARAFFMNAEEEQQRIEEKYKKEIINAAKDMGGEDSFVFKLMQNLANSAIKDNTKELMGLNCENPKIEGYSGDDCKILQAEQAFVNSYVEYMQALDAILLKEYSEADMLLAKNAAKHNDEIFKKISDNVSKDRKPSIYVVYENGESKGLEDYEISFPIPANLNHIKDNAVKLAATYATLSLNTKLDKAFIEAIGGLTEARGVFPKLTDSKSSYEFIKADNKSGDTQETKMIADMDKIITKDYNSNLTITMLKAIFDAAVKTAINMAAADKNPLLGFAANKATEAVNHSDLRRVVGLPKNYQLTMVENAGQIVLSDNEGNEIYSKSDLNANKDYIVYVKSPKQGVNYIKLVEGK